jgi:DNA-binding NtrC family response regulator
MTSSDWIGRAYRRAGGLSRGAEHQGRVRAAEERRTIMIVDDNLKMLEALLSVLQEKYDVVTCCSAAEVEKRWSDDVQLVILDIKMAPDDGVAIFSLLRRRSERVPIIFHTAYPGSSEIVARMRELTSDGCLMKGDYSLCHLEETIERTLSRRAMQQSA